MTQGVGNSVGFLNVFETRVKYIFSQDLHSRVENSSRARFYVTFAKDDVLPKLVISSYFVDYKIKTKSGDGNQV